MDACVIPLTLLALDGLTQPYTAMELALIHDDLTTYTYLATYTREFNGPQDSQHEPCQTASACGQADTELCISVAAPSMTKQFTHPLKYQY